MLAKIVAKKRRTIANSKETLSFAKLEAQALPATFKLRQALQSSAWLLIAECKLQSPAKGRLTERHTVPELAALYQSNGAGALSIHTDEHFAGSLGDLALMRQQTNLPLLRKDFILDPYQVIEARVAGADAILLIANLLNDTEIDALSKLAEELGMDALVEVHSLAEFNRTQELGCPLIGINNRDLTTFKTDIDQTFRLLEHRRTDGFIISESGIKNAADASRLFDSGVNGILVGEALVTAADPGQTAHEMATGHQYTTRRTYHA